MISKIKLRRQAIIRTAKRNINNHFIMSKKLNEEIDENNRMDRFDTDKNVFREQHHHLLSCLEHATVWIYDFDLIILLSIYFQFIFLFKIVKRVQKD
jgi:hypothetical protein